jgi:hypothetical protein
VVEIDDFLQQTSSCKSLVEGGREQEEETEELRWSQLGLMPRKDSEDNEGLLS